MLSSNRTKRVIRKFKRLSELIAKEEELIMILDDENLPEAIHDRANTTLMINRIEAELIFNYLDSAEVDTPIHMTVTRELSVGEEPVLVAQVGNTIGMFYNGVAGIAKLHPHDEFDYQVGFKIAYDRLGEQFGN